MSTEKNMEMIWSILQSIADHHEMGNGFPIRRTGATVQKIVASFFSAKLTDLGHNQSVSRLDSTQHFLVLSPFFSYNLLLYYLFPLSKAPESSLKMSNLNKFSGRSAASTKNKS
jgi:hypothetical protein